MTRAFPDIPAFAPCAGKARFARMETLRLFKALTRDQRNTFVACFLGWALDSLDFFLLTFVFSAVAQEFGKTVPEVAFASMLTLMFRPLGALLLGFLGVLFGRRRSLV